MPPLPLQLDGMGAAVIVVQTEGGAVAGGYNPKGFLGYGDWRDAISAFLFCWPDGDVARPALKMPKCGGSGMAIIDDENKGPQFGPEGCAPRLVPHLLQRPSVTAACPSTLFNPVWRTRQ